MNPNYFFQVSRGRKADGEWHRNPVILCHAKGNSSTQSNPTTTTDVTDQRVAASEGSVSAGSGASVSISTQSSDAATVKAAGDAISRIAETATEENSGVASAAISGNVTAIQEAADLGKTAILAVQSQGRDALDFGDSIVQKAINAATTSQQSANDLIQHTNDDFTSRLVQNSGEAPIALADNLVKYGALAVGAIVVVYLLKSNKAA